MIWGNMFNFSSDNVLLVLANTHFSEKDYIRDYEQFLKIKKYKPIKLKFLTFITKEKMIKFLDVKKLTLSMKNKYRK